MTVKTGPESPLGEFPDLTIAICKGRVLKDALPLFSRIGIVPAEDPETSRKLILETNLRTVTLVVIRAADVPTYVEYGAADVGVVGKDVLMEYQGDGLYEPLDLGIARCRLVIAAPKDARPASRRIRIATKYVNTTRSHFAAEGEQVEVIKLYGSMELAPLVGLADQIVDLVDTGNTLRANGLAPVKTIAHISARLVVNKAAMKIKNRAIKSLIRQLAAAIDATAQATPGK